MKRLLLLLCLLPSIASGAELLPAERGDFALKVDTGIAIPLTEPQSQLFDVGVSETIKGLWTLTPYLDLGPSITFLGLPTSSDVVGTAWAFGGSIRVKRPHHREGNALQAMSPWADADVMYVRTGSLNRPGFALAVGDALPIGKSRIFWLGPFVRYMQILQGERAGFDNTDAKLLSIGLSLEVGSGVKRAPEPIAEHTVTVTKTVTKEVPICPDRDGDGIPDGVDHCPDVAGPMDNWGCPPYKTIIVQRDKLELKEKIQFAWDEARLEDVSFPVLDEVVQALKDNKNFRVQVEGHASSEGPDDHNQTLSEERAQAVLDYLVKHGIAADRLSSKGFSSSVPIGPNATAAGREKNRRVEFIVHFIIVGSPQ